jgi:hypothetical protein
MNASTLLSPGLLEAVSVFVAGLTILMVAVQSGIFAFAARRAEISPLARVLAPFLTAALLAAWAGWAIVVVKNPVVVPAPPPVGGQAVQAPGLLSTIAAMVALGISVLFTSKTVRAINAATPPAWLIGVQLYRVAGAMFLWPFLAAGAVPAGFAWPAGIGDVITGIAAPFVALAVAQDRPGARARAVAWNCFGMLDLIVATAAAVLTQTTNIDHFPLVVVPLFLGPPLGILTHVYSLRNLAATRTRVVTHETAGAQAVTA